MASSIIRKANIQGDIWPGLPKRFETFLFFNILKPDEFKKQLKTHLPKITTAEHACQMKDKIAAERAKNGKKAPLLPLPGFNIAFSSTGLSKLGKYVLTAAEQGEVKRDRVLSKIFREKQLRGGLFEKGMYEDLTGEGWDDPEEIRRGYKPENGQRLIDGVLLVTSSVREDILEQVDKLSKAFLDTGIVSFPLIREGMARDGVNKGREHFGFVDGISQPIIKGLDDQAPHGKAPEGKEPKSVNPGLIFVGHEGDRMGQPKWAKDGSFMVIRDLQQLVPEFDKWLDDNAHRTPFAADHPKPSEKLAAYLMGRWRNGTPVDENPHHDDDPTLHTSNKFDYEPRDKHDKCPFAAHTRKMRPRADLDHDHAVIVRRGISYGDEVTQEEREARKSDMQDPAKERGLLFVCYNSDVRMGFNFLTTRWASNHHFPDRKHKFVGNEGPGIDAIVGQRLDHHPARSIGLPDGKDPTEHRMELDRWVIHRGGEYFFSPSIEAMDTYLTEAPDYPVKAKL
ncbi:Dyp-type peroxidase family [Geosmithia morbida]|uniref:Dyp-type peroxidase family n=1 Tax=Geosmithia morbida TaxID=1094350 RepID=A0A9P4YYB2_9HYPO|nr:Dyp-type peroxidase family [Geosmithia morbida]KAF4124285.1 Dyp-type peroxidase family [Geosmithia morbida]